MLEGNHSLKGLEDATPKESIDSNIESGSIQEQTASQRFTRSLTRYGVETHGIDPIPVEGRTDKRIYQLGLVWFSANFNVLAFSTGTVAPAIFGLNLRVSLLTMLIADLIACAIPAYFGVFGPKLGTRAMVQSRFSWGLYGSMIPSVLNVFSLQGFLILNVIIGGQTLASVSEHLSDAVGIVIIAVISLVLSFCGYRVLHWYETFAWIPNLIAFLIMLGVGGRHIRNIPAPPPEPSAVLSCASVVASSVMSWCTMTPDYGVYHSHRASSWRIFLYAYLGFLCSSLPGHMLGAAFAAAAPLVPAWQAGLGDGNNIGGLLESVLAMTGGFGKFLTVVIALTVPSNVAPTMYSFGTSAMSIAPFFAKIPRYFYAVISTAILIPVAIIGATRFYDTLVDVMSIIGYWTASFAAIVFAEHFIIRRADFSTYVPENWNRPSHLPLGVAAVFAFVGSVGLIILSMSQVWYTGPIAKSGTGDIGVYTGFVAAGLLYVPLRLVEMKVERRIRRGPTLGGNEVIDLRIKSAPYPSAIIP